MKKLFGALLLLGAACGDGERTVRIRLDGPELERLDPLKNPRMDKLRFFVSGDAQLDEAVIDVPLSAPEVELTMVSESASVRVEGYSLAGSVLALGRGSFTIEDGGRVDVPFRRNLAYVIHEHDPRQDQPGRVIYAIDLDSREVVDTIELPGADPRARAITARGGRDMLVTWLDGAKGFVGRLDLATHEVVGIIELPTVQDVALGVAGSSKAVALGGGQVSFLDLEAGTARSLGRAVGGRVLDAGISGSGRYVLAAIDVSPPGLLLIDLQREEVEPQAVVADPTGVAIAASGDLAYVTSGSSERVLQFDLVNRRAESLSGGLATPVQLAVYAEPLRSVLGVAAGASGTGRLLSYHVPSGTGSAFERAIETLERPTGIATDGTGRRSIVVAAGSSTTAAGFTIVDSSPNRLEGASQLYPLDEDDTFVVRPATPDREAILGRQRYQPRGVAVVFGR